MGEYIINIPMALLRLACRMALTLLDLVEYRFKPKLLILLNNLHYELLLGHKHILFVTYSCVNTTLNLLQIKLRQPFSK